MTDSTKVQPPAKGGLIPPLSPLNNVQVLTLARRIVQGLVHKGLKRSSWHSRHPDAWNELGFYKEDMEQQVFEIASKFIRDNVRLQELNLLAASCSKDKSPKAAFEEPPAQGAGDLPKVSFDALYSPALYKEVEFPFMDPPAQEEVGTPAKVIFPKGWEFAE